MKAFLPQLKDANEKRKCEGDDCSGDNQDEESMVCLSPVFALGSEDDSSDTDDCSHTDNGYDVDESQGTTVAHRQIVKMVLHLKVHCLIRLFIRNITSS